MPSDKTLEVRSGSLDATSMRYHELWLQRWFYGHFFVRAGYPVPLVFSTPMDAFSTFNKLWNDTPNPFAYLFALKDDNGTPLYEPYPSPVRYPLISVMRKGVKFRPYQNFSIHNWRHINWPTISDPQTVPGTNQQGTTLTKMDLAHVTTSRMPMAFDYRFQVDFFSLRPDTQAFFMEKLMNQFWRSGGSVLQTWMSIEYPGWGKQYIRLYIDGDIDNTVPEEYQDKQVEFRVSFTLAIEGFSVDVDYRVKPALWMLVPFSGTPEELDNLLAVKLAIDLRPGYNPVLESRLDVPSAGTISQQDLFQEWAAQGTQVISMGDQQGTVTGGNLVDSNNVPVLRPPLAVVQTSTFSYGIPSALVFGGGTIAQV